MSDTDWVLNIVQRFYDKAKSDILIGYHFRNIADFETHIPRIASFWEIQLLGKTHRVIDQNFDVLKAHLPLGIKKGELGRWLVLFRATLESEAPSDPRLLTLRDLWLEKLIFFEETFSRFFSFK